jgi:dolichol-phosphate mannosyltransferase
MNRSCVSVIVPALREAENIPELVKQVSKTLIHESVDYEILIVDDDSRDGIDAVVRKLSVKYPVKLHVRVDEKGLSSAVIKGLSLARGDIVVVMDADLSHPPSKIADMIRPIIEGRSEFVIGSRFVSGGSIPHFNWFRKLNAWVSRILASPLVSIKDPMSGFFAFPRNILPGLDLLDPVGFKIGLELLVKTRPENIMEVPIQFQKRLHGKSKLSFREQMLYLIHLRRLYLYQYKNLIQFMHFSLIGAPGILVNLVFVFLAYDVLALPYFLALIIGFVFALTSNYFLNKYITFYKAKKVNIILQYIKFFLVCLAGLLINMYVSLSLYNHAIYFKRHYLLTSLIGIICGVIINYFGSRSLVFREQHID